MASTVQVNVGSTLGVAETFSAGLPGQNTAAFAPLNETLSLNAGTTPPASQHATFNAALTAGAGTIDLTNLPGITAGEVVNGTGLKVQVAKFLNPLTNANPITLKFGALNPYNLLGASWQVSLAPGQSLLVNGNAATPAIAAGAKNIDISGTGAQALSVHLVLG